MVKSVTLILILFTLLSTAAAKTGPAGNDFGIGGTEASKGLTALFAGIILITLLPLLFIAVRKILGYVRSRREKGITEELTLEARRREKAGEFVSAALAYEKLKDLESAAELYEKGRDYIKAADVYESIGRMDKVSEMYETAGDLRRAADTLMQSGDFPGSARIYNQIGDKRKAAEALEHSGNMLAAARAYREARDYPRASALLRGAGMHKEAADMYAISLAGAVAGKANLDRFYTYASLLETAGDPERAAEVFRTVWEVDHDYRDVGQRLEAAGVLRGPRQPEPAVEPVGESSEEMSSRETAGGEVTLRKLIREGGMEPRRIFRLWVHLLRALDQRQRGGSLPQILAPDCIVIDSGNNVTFSENASKDFAYMAPEVVAGSTPDAVSSIYSMGVILYEMLAGSLDSFGMKRPGEIAENVPPWLEELTLRCLRRKREDRYRGLDEIFSVLADLKKKQA